MLDVMIKIRENFKPDTPITTDEIVALYPNYSLVYVFKIINNAIQEGSLVKFDRSVYYYGKTPSYLDVLEKWYIKDAQGNTVGFYSGNILRKEFGIPEAKEKKIMIVTNSISLRSQTFKFQGKEIYVKESLKKITEENLKIIKLLELCWLISKKPSAFSKQNGILINDYIKKNNLNNDDIIKLAMLYPDRVVKMLVFFNIR